MIYRSKAFAVLTMYLLTSAATVAYSIADTTCDTQECKNYSALDNNTGTDAAKTTSDDEIHEAGFQCGIYLAASSIPNAGFGIYTTRSIKQNQIVQPYPESPSIVVTDFYVPFGNEEEDWNHVNYVWEANGAAAFEADEVSESVMTYGSLCNYHPVLKSLAPYASAYNDTLLNRFDNPGAGAISYYDGRTFMATREIEAGEELFDDYGDHWLDNRKGTFADKVPRKQDYEKAAIVLSRIQKDLQKENNKLDESQLSILADTVSVFNKRAASVFPDTTEKLKHLRKFIVQSIQKRGSSMTSKAELTRIIARSTLEKRDIDWIKNNGVCLEKIRPQPSTIPEAGRGAFAQMFISAGDIISPAPLLNVPNKDSLLMYRSEINSEGERVKVDEEPIGHQLLLNYCFGHTESQLILCPQTNAILINHCSMRQKDNRCNNGNGPNAKVQWASKWDPTNEEWLQKSTEEIKELTADGQRGLSLEIVATTDIVPGEEVFIDYGENWENAWNSHVDDWNKKKRNDASSYIPIEELIVNKDFRTLDELKTNPYPANVQLLCYGGDLIDDEEEVNEGEVIDGRKGFAGSRDDYDEPDYSIPCDIHEKDTDTDQYKVLIKFENRSVMVKNYPQKSLKIMMKPYSGDTQMEGVFRHFIELDDDIFPSHWKDNEKK